MQGPFVDREMVLVRSDECSGVLDLAFRNDEIYILGDPFGAEELACGTTEHGVLGFIGE